MSWISRYRSSSVGRKQIVGITGLALVGFLFVHLLGNFGLMIGQEHFNRYSHMLLHTLAEFIVPLEILLLIFFFVHVILAIKVTIRNKTARSQKYAVATDLGKKTLSSRTMIWSGVWAFGFLIVHILHFKYGVGAEEIYVVYGGREMKDLYTPVMQSFSQWWYTLAYCVSMVIIGMHVSHGLQSAFQTLGINHPKYTTGIKRFSLTYAVLVQGGFVVIAVWAYFQRGGV